MLYFIMGGLMVLMSFDLKRYRPAIGYLLGTSLLFGAVLLGVDLYEGMPLHWVVCEGPCIMLLSVVMLMLWRRGFDEELSRSLRQLDGGAGRGAARGSYGV
jgi:cell division protein FtsW (lipid II flippase)